MKKFRLLLMMFLTAAVCAGFQGCSDDDDEEDGTTISDFHIECTDVSGGGLSSQECVSLRANLNAQLIDITIPQVTKSEAIEIFDQVMEEMAKSLSSSGVQPAVPLKITFELKPKDSGKCVKRATITANIDGVTVS